MIRVAGSSMSGKSHVPVMINQPRNFDGSWRVIHCEPTAITEARMHHASDYTEPLYVILGAHDEPISEIARRAELMFPGLKAVIWEADASTLEFLYVSDSAASVFGHLPSRWTAEPAFWSREVLHPEDADDAVAHCAICAAMRQDHEFEHRAVAADGRTVWVHHFVRAIPGAKGVAVRLRGVMVDVTERQHSALLPAQRM